MAKQKSNSRNHDEQPHQKALWIPTIMEVILDCCNLFYGFHQLSSHLGKRLLTTMDLLHNILLEALSPSLCVSLSLSLSFLLNVLSESGCICFTVPFRVHTNVRLAYICLLLQTKKDFCSASFKDLRPVIIVLNYAD